MIYDLVMGTGWFANQTDDMRLALTVVPTLLVAAVIVIAMMLVKERTQS